MTPLLEVIGFTIGGCQVAQAAGAYRIELCDNAGEGGTSPSYGLIKAARSVLKIQLYPIIRPRSGDFLYSDVEFQMMLDDIRICKKLGCDGIVTGILDSDGSINRHRMYRICELAYPLGVTFHRAFDRTADPFTAMETIIDVGCERILTSGQKTNAFDGIELIKDLVDRAEERIVIMPGSGICSENIKEVANKTGATEFHSSARKKEDTKMEFQNKEMNDNLCSLTVDAEEVRKMITTLQSL